MKQLGSRTIETERLLLHKTEEKDLKLLWKILKKEEISKLYLVTKINDDWEKEKKWQYKKLEYASLPNVYCWTIEKKDTHEVIGQISVQDGPKKEIEDIRDIGWFIDTPFQRQGYAYEAALEVLKYMFIEVEITEIITSVAKNNNSSWKLMEKLGFQRLKTTHFVKYTLIKDPVEVYEYQCKRKDFLKEIFRKEELYITKNIDKDPYIKHLSENSVLNIAGVYGSGKSTATKIYRNNSNCVVIDLEKIAETQKEFYKYLQKKYKNIPNSKTNFDILYQDTINYFEITRKMIIIESNYFQNIKEISLLKGDIIILRTCEDTCYNRWINHLQQEHPNDSFEDLFKYQNENKLIQQNRYVINEFIDHIDKL